MSLLAMGCILASCAPETPGTVTYVPPSLTHTPVASPSTETDSAPGLNTLTGLPPAEPELLEVPALLVSISHFPATARPQAGLSFAPIVYEVNITEGATRFLAVFYGEFPAVQEMPRGSCPVRLGVYTPDALLIGNRVWHDRNDDGRQDIQERGVAGVCVRLYDASGNLLQNTSTDTNGYYGFSVAPGTYVIEFEPPAWARFTPPHQSGAGTDSDAEIESGRTTVALTEINLAIDAGLVGEWDRSVADEPAPARQVGPIRSGRLVYGHIAAGFRNSCLIIAGASPEVMARLPVCYQVFHQLDGGGYMLDLGEMRRAARQNARRAGSDFDYTSNIFSPIPPNGGTPAIRLHVYIAYLNQSGWFYDPLYGAYLRYVDTSAFEAAGELHPDVDRLTGRQLFVENVIVLYAQHDVVTPSNLDIRLDAGRSGRAIVFRDGLMFNGSWKAPPDDDSFMRPLQITDESGRPFPLKPGHSWIIVVTKGSRLKPQSGGSFFLEFVPPEGAD